MSFRLDQTTVHVCNDKDEILRLANLVKNLGSGPAEREEKEGREAWIKAKILAGDLLPFQWAIARTPEDADGKRVNGQHSSNVFLALTDEEWPQVQWPITIILQDYQCETKKDQSILFEQFDDIRSARSKPDKVGAHLAHYPTLVAALKDRNIAVKLSSGLTWYAQKVDGFMLHVESPFELIHHNHDIHAFLVFGGSFLRQKFTSHLLHAPLLAAMYHTTRREPSDAQDFWKDVSKGTAHLDAESIQYKLADLCDMYNTHDCKWPAGVSRHLGGHKKPTELDMFGTCLRAFVAWRKGLKIGEVFVPAKGRKADALVQEFYPLPPETMAA